MHRDTTPTRRSTMAFCIICAGLMTLAAAIAVAEENESAGVSLVEVPVFVWDRHGDPVPKLAAGDFKVYEDGHEQKLDLFLAVKAPIPLPSPGAPDLPATTPGAQQSAPSADQPGRRHFILLIDLCNNSPVGLKRSRDAAIDFIDTKVREGDLASIWVISPIRGLTLRTNFTSDKPLLRSSVESIWRGGIPGLQHDAAGLLGIARSGGESALGPGSVAIGTSVADDIDAHIERMGESERREAEGKVTAYFAEFERLARSLSLMPGRKFCLLFSQGISGRLLGFKSSTEIAADAEDIARGDFPREPGLHPDFLSWIDRITRLFSSADTQIFSIETRGLYSDLNIGFVDRGTAAMNGSAWNSPVLSMFAEDTGGQYYKNMNDLRRPVADMAKKTSAYYLLGYHPPARETPDDRKFHKIKVVVAREGVTVRYRPGYYDRMETPGGDLEDTWVRIAAAVNDHVAFDAIELEAQCLRFPAGDRKEPAAIVLEIPGAQFRGQKGQLVLDVYAYALSPGGRVEAYLQGSHTVPEGAPLEQVCNAGIRYYDVLPLGPSEAHDIRVIVRNQTSNEMGSTTLEVPAATTDSGLAIATPMFLVPTSTGDSSHAPEWQNVAGFDPAKPPARLDRLSPVFPITYRGKAIPVDISPAITRGESCQVLLKVFPTRSSGSINPTDIEISAELLDSQGRVIARPACRPDGEPFVSAAAIEYTIGLDTSSCPEGAASLRVTARDRNTGATGSSQAPVGR
ncbi:MAG: VWA domain-containing protein [Acidobacteria bacterium]|nr:VWA domain-containing protein [Acidobacteriota bacterium]